MRCTSTVHPGVNPTADTERRARPRDDGEHAAVIDELYRRLRPVVNELGESLFDGAPDLLLAMAEDMDSGAEQRLYFEAIRTLKDIRGPVYLVFKTTLLGRLRDGGEPTARFPAESGELSLRDDESLEEIIAISNIVQEIEKRHGPKLFELERRLNEAVAAGVPLQVAALMPSGIAEAFGRALADVEVSPKIKLVLFRLFSHFVGGRLDGFLDAAIRALEACGFDGRRDLPHAELAPADASPELRQAAEQVHRLLNLLGDLAPGEGQPPAPGSNAELLESLRRLVQRVGGGDEQPAVQGAVQRLGMVGQLINEVTRDVRVPAALRESIDGLRLAVTKAALKDPGFIDDPNHPARRLLSDIHEMALVAGVVGGESVAELRSLIQAASAELDQPVAPVLASLQACDPVPPERSDRFLQSQAEAAARRNQRLVKRLKSIVRSEIHARVQDVDMPPSAEAFFLHGYGPLMGMLLARHGRDSRQYRSAVGRLDRLVDQLREQPLDDLLADERARMLEAIEVDLLEAGMPRGRVDQLLGGLKEAYAALEEKRQQRDARNRELLKGVRDKAAFADEGFAQRLRMDLRRLVSSAVADELATPGADEAVASVFSADPQAVERRRRALMSLLAPGTWFRIGGGDGEPPRWGRVERYFASEDIASFSGFDGRVILTVKGEELLRQVRAGKLQPVEMHDEAARRWERLIGERLPA